MSRVQAVGLIALGLLLLGLWFGGLAWAVHVWGNQSWQALVALMAPFELGAIAALIVGTAVAWTSHPSGSELRRQKREERIRGLEDD